VKRSPLRNKSDKKRRAARAEAQAKNIVRERCATLNDQMCEICCQRPADDPAHRLSSGRQGDWRASNLIAACRLCHDLQRHKDGERLATKLGQVLPSEVGGVRPDPERVPVQLVYGHVYLTDLGGVIPVQAADPAIEEVI
jgi:hypothetical protein